MGNTQPEVLVILAAFNGADWLEEQVDSILRQTGVNVTLTIGDDASTDSTSNLLQKLAQDPRIRLLPAPHPTGSAAKNFFRLFQHCDVNNFDLVAFSDQDDTWIRTKLQRAYNTLQQNPNAAGYSSATIAAWPDGRKRLQTQSTHITRRDFLLEGAGQGCTFALRPKFFKEFREIIFTNPTAISTIHYHDWAVYAVARATNYTWIFDSEPTVIYRQHSKNDTGARRNVRGIIRRLKLISNGWYREQIIAISTLACAANSSSRFLKGWAELIRSPASLVRQLKLCYFLVTGGRRKLIDTILVTFAALCGMI
jgi:rhamnosyltransferase